MVEPTEPPFVVQSAINWSICVLCQEDTGESLQCPANTRRNDISLGSGYKFLAENIFAFCSLGCPPLPIYTSKINEGDGIEATLKRNAAKWHKNCRNKFNTLKLERAAKRKRLNECDTPIAKRARNSLALPRHVQSLIRGVFSAKQIAQRHYTRFQPSILIRVFGSVPFYWMIRGYWLSLVQATWFRRKRNTTLSASCLYTTERSG